MNHLEQQARAFQNDLRAHGVQAEVRPGPGLWNDLDVLARATVPLGLDDGETASTVLTIGMRVDGFQVQQRDAAAVIARRIQQELTEALLSRLVAYSKRRELGVHRRALAPYAREVVDTAVGRATYLDPASVDFFKMMAMPFTDADGLGRDR